MAGSRAARRAALPILVSGMVQVWPGISTCDHNIGTACSLPPPQISATRTAVSMTNSSALALTPSCLRNSARKLGASLYGSEG